MLESCPASHSPPAETLAKAASHLLSENWNSAPLLYIWASISIAFWETFLQTTSPSMSVSGPRLRMPRYRSLLETWHQGRGPGSPGGGLGLFGQEFRIMVSDTQSEVSKWGREERQRCLWTPPPTGRPATRGELYRASNIQGSSWGPSCLGLNEHFLESHGPIW